MSTNTVKLAGTENYKPKCNKNYISFGTKMLDDLFDGGARRGDFLTCFSEPDLGKSFLCKQLACCANLPKEKGGLGLPVLVVDTENDYTDEVLDRAYKIFAKRWDVPESTFAIDVWKAPKVHDLTRMFGADLLLSCKKETGHLTAHFDFKNTTEVRKGKQKIYHDYYESSPIFQKVKDNNYPLIIFDSLSEPIKAAIPPAIFNFGVRSYIQTFIINGMRSLVTNFNTAIFVTTHVSKADTNYADKGRPYGGRSVTYNMKNLLYLRRGLSNQQGIHGKGVRRAERYRMKMMLEKEILVSIVKDYGFVGVKE